MQTDSFARKGRASGVNELVTSAYCIVVNYVTY